MSYFSPRPSVPASRADSPVDPPVDPPASRSGAAPVAPGPAETPAERRAMAIAEREYPRLAYQSRRTLVRAIAAMVESPYMTAFERAVRAAYYAPAGVVEVTPECAPLPTAVDAVARELTAGRLGAELPGLAPHAYRALVTRTLQAIREGTALSPHQARIANTYRKAASELATERE